jgi:SUMO ligase MMS21 Smc5/6 complex component
MFGVLKQEASWGQRFAIDEVKNVVHMYLQSPSHTFSAYGIGRLVNCYIVCVKKRAICSEMIHFAFVTHYCTRNN